MINTLLIDDEPGNLRVLRAMLEKYCIQVNIIGEAMNVEQGEDLIKKFRPELVFLDIEMPYGNAFDLLDRLRPIEFEVIFVTAFHEYTLKAFKYSALDYLLKPVNINELTAAVNKASTRMRFQQINRQLNNLLLNMKQPEQGGYKLALPHMEGLVFVRMDQIVRCEAQGGYTNFYMKDGEKVLSTGNIKDYEDLLPSTMFIRVHNSHIINLTFVKKYHKGRGGYIEMDDGAVIDVAIRRKSDFLSRFGY